MDARCNKAGHDAGWLLPHGAYSGAGAPVTPSMGVTIHPRVKRQAAARAQQVSLLEGKSRLEGAEACSHPNNKTSRLTMGCTLHTPCLSTPTRMTTPRPC